MGVFSSISSDAFNQLQFNAGMLLKTFDPSSPSEPAAADIICPTSGGITASCKPKIVNLAEKIDNMKKCKETVQITEWDCKITTTGLGTSKEQIAFALGAADIVGNKIVPRGIDIETDFRDIWWVGERTNGSLAACKLKNALSTEGFEIKTGKEDLGTVPLSLEGFYSFSNMEDVPMEFYSIDEVQP